ncbi:unnamed protein product [Caenorhabditis angaria]|uniref:Annexin n=1 Tax=Caenorhabditis angaria TaxID=860376 RepID=A0A9P1IJM2_9PELO|nr:unnamed protein product [Caenorhabditis angaria]
MYWIFLIFLSISTASSKDFDIFDAQDLHRALQHPVNTKQIIKTLCNRDRLEIEKIIYFYQKIYNYDLRKVVDENLGEGNFKYFTKSIIFSKPYYEAKVLHDAEKKLGTDEEIFIELLVARSNEEIDAIKKAYRDLYGIDLEDELERETSGEFLEIMLAIIEGRRDESNKVDLGKAKKDAEKLYYAGVGRLGTQVGVFNKIFTKQNFAQLRLVFDEYQKYAEHSIEVAVDKETSGYYYSTLSELVQVIRNKPNYFARFLWSDDERMVIRTIVLRSEIDLGEIVEEFGGKMRLKGLIEKKISGDLRNALVTFLEYQLRDE